MEKINKKLLVIDSSGIRPFVFAEAKLGLSQENLENFSNSVNLDLKFANSTISEFSFAYTSQISIFEETLTSSLLSGKSNKNTSIIMSDAGYFSLTSDRTEQLSIKSSKIKTNEQSKLWELSPHWELLSPQDKDIITLAINGSRTYEEVAILTNDWHLREQCLNFENIHAYGSCSMLAGMVLTNFITYQKGTYIYNGWLNFSPRWIPYCKNEHGIKRKLRFSEVLAIEKGRMQKGNSFWLYKNN